MEPIRVAVALTASQSRTRDGEFVTFHMQSLVFAEEGNHEVVQPRVESKLLVRKSDLRRLLGGQSAEVSALMSVE